MPWQEAVDFRSGLSGAGAGLMQGLGRRGGGTYAGAGVGPGLMQGLGWAGAGPMLGRGRGRGRGRRGGVAGAGAGPLAGLQPLGSHGARGEAIAWIKAGSSPSGRTARAADTRPF